MNVKVVVLIAFVLMLLSSSIGGGIFYFYNSQTTSSTAPSDSSTPAESNTSAESSSPAPSESGCVTNWMYQKDRNKSDLTGPYAECTLENSDEEWCMMPAYIVGGQENIAWKYTNDPNDPACLTNWTYYDKDGNIIKDGVNIERTITWDSGSDSVNRWCPLKTYIEGGKENIAWKYC